MNRVALAASMLGAAFGLNLTSAWAGPCAKRIAQLEKTVHDSKSGPDAGPGAPQSIAAQLDRQPTPRSIKRADEKAQAGFDAALARAKALDAQGKRAACIKALNEAKLIYLQ